MEWDDPEVLVVFQKKLPTIGAATRQLIGEAMRRVAGDRTTAAELLGISEKALEKRMAGKKNE